MSRLFSENFDFWPISTPVVGASVIEEPIAPWAGAASAACASGAFNVIELHPAGVLGRKYYYRIAGKLAKLPENTTAILRLLNGEATKIEMSISESGEVKMWNGVAHPTETSPKITVGEWFVIEVMCQVNAEGNGLISWRFNGVQKAAEQAFSVGNLGINKARFGNPGGAKSGTPVLIDGMAINDDQGETNNTWPGIEPDPIPAILKRYWGGLAGETEATGPTEPAPYNEEVWDEFEAQTGKRMGVVHMGDPWGEGEGPIWDGYFEGAADRIHARGGIVMKSLGGESGVVQEVLSGAIDDGIVAWAEAARDFAHPMFLRLWWEMNGTWFPWGRQAVTGAEYIEAWRHFHDIVSAIAPNVTFIWCPNVFTAAFPEYNPYTGPAGNCYPGDAYVDWIGVDGYASENPHKLIGYPNAKALLGFSYESFQAVSPSKPIIICETSASEYATKEQPPEPPKKAEWIRAYLQHTVPSEMPNIRAVVWFNWYIEEGGGRIDWPIGSSPSAEAAVKTALEESHWVDPEVAFFDDLTKVPIPGEVAGGTVITRGPRTGRDTTAVFEFTGEPEADHFEARINGGEWAEVSSPWTIPDLAPGAYNVEIRGVTDIPDPTPATWGWRIHGIRVLTGTALSLLEDLPGWAQYAPEFQALCQVYGRESERMMQLAREVRDGMIPMRANLLTLPLWESLLKIAVNPPLTEAERRAAVLAGLRRALADPSGLGWEERVTELIGPSWSYDEEEEQTIRVKVPWAPGSENFLIAERVIRRLMPAAWELILESDEGFVLDLSKLDKEPFHAS